MEKIGVRRVANFSSTDAVPVPVTTTLPWWGWLGVAGLIAGAATGLFAPIVAALMLLVGHWLKGK